MTDHVHIQEVGLRDGLQSIATTMPTEAKKRWISAAYDAGLRQIEVTSFVPPRLLPQLADAAQIVDYALQFDGLTVTALVPNLKGAENAEGRRTPHRGADLCQYAAQPGQCPAHTHGDGAGVRPYP